MLSFICAVGMVGTSKYGFLANREDRYHILAHHSKEVASFWNQLDYIGIVILVWAATIPAIYLAFFEHGKLQRIYWSSGSFGFRV